MPNRLIGVCFQAGTTDHFGADRDTLCSVIAAQAAIHEHLRVFDVCGCKGHSYKPKIRNLTQSILTGPWLPAFAGMTLLDRPNANILAEGANNLLVIHT